MRSLLRRGRLRTPPASLWALLLTSAGASLGCVWLQSGVALRPGDRPRVVGFQRVTNADAFRWAAPVTKRICELETVSAVHDASTTGAPTPPSGGWTRFEGVPNRRYTVLSRTEATTFGMKSPWLALLVKDDTGSTAWLRNVPSQDEAASVAAWRCVVDESLLAREALTERAEHVELAVSNGSCGEITPILGGLRDLTTMPYTVAGTGLYAGRDPDRASLLQGSVGAVSEGLQLESDGGTRRLTVPLDDYRRCFVRADHPPPLPREATALTEWLATPAPDQTDPPAVAFDAVRTVAGIDSALCSRFPMGKEAGLECRMPVVRWEPESGSGPYGPSRMVLVRDRVVDAFHLVGEKLVPAEKAIRLTAVVRMRGAAGTAFASALDEATKAASGDPALARERSKRGFRLLRERDAPAGTATHVVELEVAFNIPELETTKERATHVWSAGKKRVHNEAYDIAQKALEQARHDLESRKTEAKLIEALAKKAAEAAESKCSSAAGGGLFGALAGAACGGGANAVGSGVAQARVVSAATQLAQAEQTASATPQELEIDDQRTYEYESTVLRRRGEARATVSVHPIAGAADARAVSTVRVPFDARDVETPASPAHKLEGHKASPPTPEAVQATLAKAMVPLVDAAVQKWADEHRVGGDVGSLQPGSRSWLVSVARRAANDRYVKLLADVEEARISRFAKPYVVPITIPEGSASRCFTIAASPSDRSADVNLEVAAERGEAATKHIALVARDRRTASDAGVDLCGLSPGRYAASVTFAGEPQGSVQIALFESTPDRMTRADTELAVRSMPASPPTDGMPSFDGSGVVKFKGSAGTEVVGMAGDRDGDGVTDDVDRCPSDPETKNGYLDGDGCPDDAPSGAPPVGVAAESAPALAVDAPTPSSARASAPADPPGPPPVKKQPWWLKPKVPAGAAPTPPPASAPPGLPPEPTEQRPAAAPAPPAASAGKGVPWWLKPKRPAATPTTAAGVPRPHSP